MPVSFVSAQALWHTALTALVPVAMPRVDLMLPYCAVCGDPNMPSFTSSQYGPIVPPNVTGASWSRTASGHGYTLLFGRRCRASLLYPVISTCMPSVITAA